MYKLNSIDYPYNALEPMISENTIFIHHTKHHQNYLDNLNKLLNENNYDYRYTKEELVSRIDIFPLKERGSILFNLGGVLNHDLYFDIIGPNNHEIKGSFKDKVIKQYGSFENFKNEFIRQAKILVGSGYTFLVLNKENDLEIINTSNQDTPYSYNLIPIMNIDLWEHAYYLDYQNKKDEYINNFFSIIDYDKVNKHYEEALQKNI